MQIGKLRHYVNLQNYSISRNAVGEVIKVWTTYASVWAKISPISASNYEAGEQEDYELTHSITIRYSGTITPQDRITYNSEIYEVVEVINYDNRKIYQIVKAKQILPENDSSYTVNAQGHSNELINYVEESEGYNFLDVDNWLLYTRNSITYNPSDGEEATYYFNTPLSVSTNETEAEHNDLSGIQGGTLNEYYHLTESQHNILTNGSNADALHTHEDTTVIPSHGELTGLTDDDHSQYLKLSGRGAYQQVHGDTYFDDIVLMDSKVFYWGALKDYKMYYDYTGGGLNFATNSAYTSNFVITQKDNEYFKLSDGTDYITLKADGTFDSSTDSFDLGDNSLTAKECNIQDAYGTSSIGHWQTYGYMWLKPDEGSDILLIGNNPSEDYVYVNSGNILTSGNIDVYGSLSVSSDATFSSDITVSGTTTTNSLNITNAYGVTIGGSTGLYTNFEITTPTGNKTLWFKGGILHSVTSS